MLFQTSNKAVRAGNTQAARALLSHGGDPGARNKTGERAVPVDDTSNLSATGNIGHYQQALAAHMHTARSSNSNPNPSFNGLAGARATRASSATGGAASPM